jgi:hypothetical protein
MIDLKNKILFIHIPKTAGKSVEHYFHKIRGLEEKNRVALGLYRNTGETDLARGNSHCSLKMYEDYYFGGEISSDFKIFTVIRDPYARFWSELAYRRLPPPSRFPISFRISARVLAFLARKKYPILRDLNCHMIPQSDFIDGQSRDRVEILRFENLAEDFAALKKKWDLPDVPLPLTNASKKKKKNVRSMLVADRFVEDFYARDLEMFSYKKR